MTQLWLVRHGQTAWSVTNRHTGRTDLPLTAEGERTARQLTDRLAQIPAVDLVLASPLQRAWRTAQLAGLHPQPEPAAVERDYGEYEGRTTAEIQAEQPGWSVWTHPVQQGESLGAVAARADEVIARVRRESVGAAILVSHGHFLRVLAARWIDADPLLARSLLLQTAAVSVLGDDRGTPAIVGWNR